MSHSRKHPEIKESGGGVEKRGRLAAGVASGVVILALVVTLPILLRRHDREIHRYSGAPTDNYEQLTFYTGQLGPFSDRGEQRSHDGRYSHHILCRDAVDVWLWRDRERPDLPLKHQIREKYPDLSRYQSRKQEGGSVIVTEKCSFTVKDGNKETFHTSALIRHGGWDYLVDLSVDSAMRDSFSQYIDQVIDGMFFV